jgi:hypothetical protein
MSDAIMKQNTRILTPYWWEELLKVMESESKHYPILCTALLYSGMRPVEFKRYQPSWYKGSRHIIKLPEGACLKQKCEFKERTILLSMPGCDAFDRLNTTLVPFKGKEVPVLDLRPEKVSFGDTLKRYAVKAKFPEADIVDKKGNITYTGPDAGICPKMFRKTLVSWYTACFPEKSLYIQASMGHDQDTIVKNYIGLGFTPDEVETMKSKYLIGWGNLV